MTVNLATSGVSAKSLHLIQDKCLLRDRMYSKDFFRGESYFTVLEPLLDCILASGGVPKGTNDREHPLPETTATCLLALYRMRLIDNDTVSLMQHYLLSTNIEVAGLIQSQRADHYIPDWEACAWSANEGANVWSTANALWALIVSQYRGQYYPSVLASVLWLTRQQAVDGGWPFVNQKHSQSNVFLTSTVLYVLNLAQNCEGFSLADDARLRRV